MEKVERVGKLSNEEDGPHQNLATDQSETLRENNQLR